MKKVTIKRLETGGNGTFGALIFESIPFAVTLEREWLNNQPSVNGVPGSCIPEGVYVCKRVISPHFGNTFKVTNVINRSNILFHKGNLDSDSRGCILVAEEFGKLNGDSGVLNSKHGYNEFKNLMSDVDEFELTIINCFDS